MNTSDAIAIAAACIGAGLTVLAVVIAIAAFFGFDGVRKLAREDANLAARDEVQKLILHEGGLSDKLKEEISKCVQAEADKLFADLTLSSAYPRDSQEEPGKVAESYPKVD